MIRGTPSGLPRSCEPEPLSHTIIGVLALLFCFLAFAGIAWAFASSEDDAPTGPAVVAVSGEGRP